MEKRKKIQYKKYMLWGFNLFINPNTSIFGKYFLLKIKALYSLSPSTDPLCCGPDFTGVLTYVHSVFMFCSFSLL